MWEEAATLEKTCQLVCFLLFILSSSDFSSFVVRVSRKENRKVLRDRGTTYSLGKDW